MPYLDSAGVRLYYESTGSGTPIVFVHEFAGDHRSWNDQVRFLSRRHRCITFNARGYPPSDVPDGEDAYSHTHAVADIRNVMHGLGIDSAHLVGLSMGGYATLNFAIAHPGMVRSMVVAAAGHGSDPERREGFLADTRQLADRLLSLGMEEGIRHYADSTVRKRLREKDPRGFEVFNRQFAEHSPLGTALTALGYQMKRPTIYSLEPALRALQTPALIVTGDDDDACIGPALFMKRSLPQARLCVMPRTTHAVNLEEPEWFNRFVADFIDEIDCAAAAAQTQAAAP